MAALRHAWLLIALTVLVGCEEQEVPEPSKPTSKPAKPAIEAPQPTIDVQKESATALKVLSMGLWDELNRYNVQGVNAVVALVFGMVALCDGRSLMRWLVIFMVGFVVFYMVLTQLHWSGWGIYLKYVLALECAVFMGFTAYRGFGQTQITGSTELLLGFGLGCYLYHIVQGWLEILMGELADTAPFFVIVFTLTVGAGSWMMSERNGAGLVFGVLAPVLGGSLVVASMGFLVMLACSTTYAAQYLKIQVPEGSIPSVFQFWLMFVSPTHTQAVGIFIFLGLDWHPGQLTIETDRVLGMLFWAIFAVAGILYQYGKHKKFKERVRNEEVKDRLLKPKDPESP